MYIDSIHLNCTSAGYKFCVVFVDRVSSYLTAVPVKALKVVNILEAITTYLSIMPFPKNFKSDLGPEYCLKFTTELARYGILHERLLPNRSNQQGNVEGGIKLLRGMLSKLVALNKFGGCDEWTTSLPVVVKNINESCAYGSPLSRSALQFSPFHHSNPALVLDDPFLLQKNNLDMLNLKRIQKLQNKGVSKTIYKYRLGNYVLLKGLTKIISG